MSSLSVDTDCLMNFFKNQIILFTELAYQNKTLADQIFQCFPVGAIVKNICDPRLHDLAKIGLSRMLHSMIVCSENQWYPVKRPTLQKVLKMNQMRDYTLPSLISSADFEKLREFISDFFFHSKKVGTPLHFVFLRFIAYLINNNYIYGDCRNASDTEFADSVKKVYELFFNAYNFCCGQLTGERAFTERLLKRQKGEQVKIESSSDLNIEELLVKARTSLNETANEPSSGDIKNASEIWYLSRVQQYTYIFKSMLNYNYKPGCQRTGFVDDLTQELRKEACRFFQYFSLMVQDAMVSIYNNYFNIINEHQDYT